MCAMCIYTLLAIYNFPLMEQTKFVKDSMPECEELKKRVVGNLWERGRADYVSLPLLGNPMKVQFFFINPPVIYSRLTSKLLKILKNRKVKHSKTHVTLSYFL